jgi:hypothetical protein
LGTQLRDYALRISRERYALRQEILQSGFQSADTLAGAKGTAASHAAGTPVTGTKQEEQT